MRPAADRAPHRPAAPRLWAAGVLGQLAPLWAQPADIRPAKPPLDVPDFLAPYRLLLYYTAAVVALWLLSLLALRAWRRWQARQPAPATPAEALLPHVIALRRLQELEQLDLAGRGLVDQYYVRLSAILRVYLAQRFQIKAEESTTSELARALSERGVGDAVVAQVRELMNGCDRVKFAEHQPRREIMAHWLAQSRNLVQQTAGDRQVAP